MAVQQSPLWHAADNVPKLTLVHALFGKGEHYAWKHVYIAFHKAVFKIPGPQSLLLLETDLVNDGAGLGRGW
jgi:hypothetical protein